MYTVGQLIDKRLSAPWDVSLMVTEIEDFGETVIVTTTNVLTGETFHRSANLPKSCAKCMRFPMDLRTLDEHTH